MLVGWFLLAITSVVECQYYYEWMFGTSIFASGSSRMTMITGARKFEDGVMLFMGGVDSASVRYTITFSTGGPLNADTNNNFNLSACGPTNSAVNQCWLYSMTYLENTTYAAAAWKRDDAGTLNKYFAVYDFQDVNSRAYAKNGKNYTIYRLYRMDNTISDNANVTVCIPGSNKVLFMGVAYLIDYVTGNPLLRTVSKVSTNFKYVICIDASTCIAADDSVVLRYYTFTSSGFLGGNDNIPLVPLVGGTVASIGGISAMRSLGLGVLAQGTTIHLVNLNAQTVVYSIPEAFPISYLTSTNLSGDKHFLSAVETNGINCKVNTYVIYPTSFLRMNTFNSPRAYPISWLQTTAEGDFLAFLITASAPKDYFVYEKKPCHTSCATCSGPNDNQCTSCGCGYMTNTSTSCQRRPNYCLECGSSNAVNCSKCPSGTNLLMSGLDGTCPVNCPGNYFLNATDNVCNLCSSNCATCALVESYCTSCPTGLLINSTSFQCQACGSGKYSEGIYCYDCPVNCTSCANGSFCTTCAPNSYFYGPSTNTVCTPCIGNKYIDGAYCKDCNTNCTACSNITNNVSFNCTACALTYLISISDRTCTPCGLGFYDAGDDICDKCDSPCSACVGRSTNCTSCETGVLSTNNTCINCGAGFFIRSNDSRCATCHTNCAECMGDATNCTVCTAGQNFYELNQSCGVCSVGNFVDFSTFPPVCKPCDGSCGSCVGISTNCTNCPSSTLLNETTGLCMSCQVPGYSLISGNCTQCTPQSKCAKCPNVPNKCTECPSSYPYLRLDSGNKCTSDCPSTNYYFTNGSVTYCDLCNANCLTCSGTAAACTSCRIGSYFTPNGACSNCSSTCKSCFGSAASCTSCIAGQYLSATNTCVPCTENGYYHNSTNCLQCDSSCLTCNGSTSTDCLTCKTGWYRRLDHSCVEIQGPLTLDSSVFKNQFSSAIFTFSGKLKSQQDLSSDLGIELFRCAVGEALMKLKNNSNHTRNSSQPCESVTDWRAVEMTARDKELRIKLDGASTLKSATLVVTVKKIGVLASDSNVSNVYPEDYLIVENVTVIKSALDGMMDSAAIPVSVMMSATQSIVMATSLPQAFILLKILQTLDYYIYIECDYPSNFAKFLEMTSGSAFDYVPNFFEFMVDDDGLPLYERFAEYGMKVHIFANLGQIYSTVLLALILKSMLFILGTFFKKASTWHHRIGGAVFIGFFESYHIQFLLSVMIFVAQRERVNHRQDAVKYLVIVFVSLFSLFMISMYLFMGYTVSRLTDSYFKHEKEGKGNMKNERLECLIEDKNMHGNIFQRHFNLIQLFKDIVFAALLYALYYKPLVLIILLTLIQALYTAMMFKYSPYNKKILNNSLKATQVLYLLLMVEFLLVYLCGEVSEEFRYYGIGFMMIGTTLSTLACTVGFAVYSAYKEIRQLYSVWKARKNDIDAAEKETGHKSLNITSRKNPGVSISSVQDLNDSSFIVKNPITNFQNEQKNLPKTTQLKKASVAIRRPIPIITHYVDNSSPAAKEKMSTGMQATDFADSYVKPRSAKARVQAKIDSLRAEMLDIQPIEKHEEKSSSGITTIKGSAMPVEKPKRRIRLGSGKELLPAKTNNIDLPNTQLKSVAVKIKTVNNMRRPKVRTSTREPQAQPMSN